MRKIKTHTLGHHLRTFLLDMLTEYIFQCRVHQVRNRMVCRATRTINLIHQGIYRSPRLELTRNDLPDMRDDLIGKILRIVNTKLSIFSA